MEQDKYDGLILYDSIIKIPIYNIKLKIVLSNNNKKFLNSFGYDGNDICSFINYVEENNNLFDMVCSFEYDKIKENYIVHEAFHITSAIMRYINCKLSLSSEESWAYLLDYIYKAIRIHLIKLKQNFIDGNTNSAETI